MGGLGGQDPGRVNSTTDSLEDGTYLNTLSIRGVVDSDAGLYVCFGSNSAGYSYRSAYLTVNPREYHSGLSISETVEDRAKVTINGLYKVVHGLMIAAKMYDLR